MKPQKLIFISAFCSLLVLFSFETIDLYTKDQILYLLERLHQSYYNYTYSLGDFLYANAHTHIDEKIIKKGISPCGAQYEQKWRDGKDLFPVGCSTPDFYKKGWRTYLANNPEMAYKTLNKYKKFVTVQS